VPGTLVGEEAVAGGAGQRSLACRVQREEPGERGALRKPSGARSPHSAMVHPTSPRPTPLLVLLLLLLLPLGEGKCLLSRTVGAGGGERVGGAPGNFSPERVPLPPVQGVCPSKPGELEEEAPGARKRLLSKPNTGV
jgi:hypothetical protein